MLAIRSLGAFSDSDAWVGEKSGRLWLMSFLSIWGSLLFGMLNCFGCSAFWMLCVDTTTKEAYGRDGKGVQCAATCNGWRETFCAPCDIRTHP